METGRSLGQQPAITAFFIQDPEFTGKSLLFCKGAEINVYITLPIIGVDSGPPIRNSISPSIGRPVSSTQALLKNKW